MKDTLIENAHYVILNGFQTMPSFKECTLSDKSFISAS